MFFLSASTGSTEAPPIMKNTKYRVELVSCNEAVILVSHQGKQYELKLFNMRMDNSDGYAYVCERMEAATRLEFLIDPAATSANPLEALIYVDHNLLQQELIAKAYAHLKIRNPEYLHFDQLQESAQAVQAQTPLIEEPVRTYTRDRANQFLLINAGIICSLVIGLFAYRFYCWKKQQIL